MKYIASAGDPGVILLSILVIVGAIAYWVLNTQIKAEQAERKAFEDERKAEHQERSKQHSIKLQKYKSKVREELKRIHSDYSEKDGVKLKLIEPGLFIRQVKNDQARIQAINPDFIKNFVKLDSYLRHRHASINALFSHVKQPLEWTKTHELYNFDIYDAGESAERMLKRRISELNYLQVEIDAYTAISYNAFHLVNSLLEDDMVTFYQIYESLDLMNLWSSNYERLTLKSLQDVNFNLENIIQQNQAFSEQIISGLGSLTIELSKQNNKLESLYGAATAGNLIAAVNALQLHRIKNNTKAMLP